MSDPTAEGLSLRIARDPDEEEPLDRSVADASPQTVAGARSRA